MAAVLYALIEEANSPQSKPLRAALYPAANTSEAGDRRLMQFVLDPLIPQHLVLAVWNDQGFFEHLKRAFRDLFAPQSRSNEDILDKLQFKLNFQVANCRLLPHYPPSTLLIVLEDSQEGTVLLYKQYAVDSIVMTPCGHYFPKWDLFAQARQAMGRPSTDEQFRNKANDTSLAIQLQELYGRNSDLIPRGRELVRG